MRWIGGLALCLVGTMVVVKAAEKLSSPMFWWGRR
jgi:hypothetical protein